MTRKEFAAEFIKFIDENFKAEKLNKQPIGVAEIKEALKRKKNDRVHRMYNKFLNTYRHRQSSLRWELTDFDRVAKWMKWHPAFNKVLIGTYTIDRSRSRFKIKRHKNIINL